MVAPADMDDQMPALVTIDQVPDAHNFMEWAKQQDATTDRTGRGAELGEAE